jgi:hypothetical protein
MTLDLDAIKARLEGDSSALHDRAFDHLEDCIKAGHATEQMADNVAYLKRMFAAARTDIPALVAEVERLREVNALLTKRWTRNAGPANTIARPLPTDLDGQEPLGADFEAVWDANSEELYND